MKQSRLRGTLLATSSALALVVAIGQSAEACTVVTNPGLPYAQAGNTCVTFTASPGTTGNITNTGTVTASGPSNPSGTGISLFLHPTVTGSIINQGTINATGFGVLMDQAQLNGSITNATGATLNATGSGGAGIQVQGTRAAIATEGVSGSIINNGTIMTAAGVGINVGDVTIGAGITNNGTVTSLTAIVVSEAMVTGNVSNGVNGHLTGNSTGVVQVVNGGTINGSVQNFGTITNNNVNGAGIYVYSSIGGIGTQAITGSIVNETNASISGGTGIKVVSILNTAAVVIGSGHAGDGVINAGTIGTSLNPVAHTGIEIGSATVNGVVSNSGTIRAAENGIQLINLKGTTGTYYTAGPTVVTGGVTNSGSITSTGTGYAGIALSGTTVANGITNSNTGTINAANGVGILLSDTGKHTNSAGSQSTFVGGASVVTGGITNQGTIIAKTGIMVTGGSTVTGGITNSGTLTGTTAAIDVTGEGAATTINQQAGTITGAILLSTNADIVNITGGTLSGNIVGQGSSNTVNIAPGSGNTFTYANAISGVNAVNVNSGILDLTGSIAATLTTVNSGAELTGTGTVGTTMIAANGGFAPGNGTPGTSMTVSGNLAFASGALYMVQINPTTASFATVTGTATLGGATVDAVYANGTYIAKQYTILTATGGVSGAFTGPVNTNLPANFTASLSYDAHDAYLNLTLNFVPPPNTGLNQNQQNVANALVNYFNTHGSIPLVFGGLTAAGLTQVSGQSATGTQQVTFDAMSQFLGLMTDPFIGTRGNAIAGGSSATPFAAEIDAANAYAAKDPARSQSEREAYAAIYRKVPPPVATFVPSWSVWTAGFGGSQTTNGNAVVGSNSTTSSLGAVAVGADYRFSPDTIAGFAMAGGGTNFNVNGLGSGRSDLFQAGAFVRHTVGPAYFTAALAYGWQDITTDRIVTVAGFDHLRAQFNANAFSGRVEDGYRFMTPWMGITPYAAAQFTTFDLPSYAEQAIVGANTFALAYGAKSVTDVRSEIGVRTDKSWAMTDSILTLRGRLAWAHDYDPDRSIGATFQTLPGASFVVNGAAQLPDKALTSASAEVKWRNGFAVAATFEGEFSGNSSSYAGKGIVRYTW